jgi:hypothetical protein
MIGKMDSGGGKPPVAPELQMGFPGAPKSETTYVGSWQWNVHGEAMSHEFVKLAASATLAAIEAQKARARPERGDQGTAHAHG